MNYETKTLVVFVVCFVLNALGLIVDILLARAGCRTITEHVWENGWLGIPIVAVQVVALISMVLHLWR